MTEQQWIPLDVDYADMLMKRINGRPSTGGYYAGIIYLAP